MVPQISHVNSCMDVISFLILIPQAGTMGKNERGIQLIAGRLAPTDMAA